MIEKVERALEARESTLLIGEEASAIVTILRNRYHKLKTAVKVSLAGHYRNHQQTLTDYLSDSFQLASHSGRHLLIDNISAIIKDDPINESYLYYLVTIYSGVGVLVTSRNEMCRYFQNAIYVPELMDAEDTMLFGVERTCSYSDYIRGLHTVSTSDCAEMTERGYCPMEMDKVGGLRVVKKKLMAAVESLDTPHKTAGVLLHGPPGTGKTLLARALPTHLHWPMLVRSIGDLLHSHIGESERAIQKLFEDAAKLQPCIIFLDELDSLFTKGTVMGRRMAVNLADQFDELKRRDDRVLVLGASNNVERVEPGLLRVGRFELLLFVGPPDQEDRADLLRVLGVHEGILEELAGLTQDMTGAELHLLVQSAKAKGNDLSRVEQFTEILLQTCDSR
jgi:ATP-dependent 26S proteasome regulatory subunit